MTEAPAHWSKVRSFKRRGKRITPGQQSAYDSGWAKWGVGEPAALSDLRALFGELPVVLEIGFGMGEGTAEMAHTEPAVGVLACDIHRPGIGALLREIELRDLANVRILDDDITDSLAFFKPESLRGVRIFFPDPWPKTKHHKRRLIQPDFVSRLVGLIHVGGFLHVASDWQPYVEWIAEVLGNEPLLRGGEVPRPTDRALTRFERQGIAKGHRVTDLVFTRLEKA